jgi:hypothetical protein
MVGEESQNFNQNLLLELNLSVLLRIKVKERHHFLNHR